MKSKLNMVYDASFGSNMSFKALISCSCVEGSGGRRSGLRIFIHSRLQLGLVADPVIEAIARLEFEDGLRTGVLP